MWELDHKEGWALKNWCFSTVVLEKTLENPLDGKEIKYSLEMLKMKHQYFGTPDVENQLIGKDPDAGKDWGQEEMGATEKEMTGWRHWLNGEEFQQTPGDSEGQGSLACCSPRRSKSQTWLTEQQEWSTWIIVCLPSLNYGLQEDLASCSVTGYRIGA